MGDAPNLLPPEYRKIRVPDWLLALALGLVDSHSQNRQLSTLGGKNSSFCERSEFSRKMEEERGAKRLVGRAPLSVFAKRVKRAADPQPLLFLIFAKKQ